jgi:cytochrome c biogenesis protein CcmG/thiol:disulfide interchange protein DsbE
MAPPAERGRLGSSRARTIAIMGVTAVAILAVSYLANKPAAGGSFTSIVLAGRATGPAPEIGKPAPDFTATTLEGEKVTLSKLRGHPVWLTVGASWCQPCRAENPDIEATYEKYRDKGLKLVAVLIQDNRSDIESYARRAGLTYPKIDDADGAIASSYRIVGIPSHFFIDSAGILREIRITSLDPETMEENLAEIGVDVAR